MQMNIYKKAELLYAIQISIFFIFLKFITCLHIQAASYALTIHTVKWLMVHPELSPKSMANISEEMSVTFISATAFALNESRVQVGFPLFL